MHWLIRRIKQYYDWFAPSAPSSHLMVREWIAVALICGWMLGLVAASKVPRYAKQYMRKAASKQGEPLLDVAINGSVERPGVYQVHPRTKVRELMDLAQVTPEGKTDCRNGEKTLRQGQSVRVSKKQKKLKTK